MHQQQQTEPLVLLVLNFFPNTRLQAPPSPVDMADCTDAFMTLAAVAACRCSPARLVPVASPHLDVSFCSRGVTRIIGVGNQRVKECNRIAATVQALQVKGQNAILHCPCSVNVL